MAEPRSPNDDALARRAPPRRRTALWIWLVVLLATAAAGRWYVWPKLQAWWNDDVATVVAPAAQTTVEPTQARLAALQQAVEQQRDATESVLAGLRSSVAQMQTQVSSASTGEARLAEVEHLLVKAREHAELEADPHTALRLLGAADALMADSGDPRYLPVRRALALDVANVRAQAAVDIEGVYVRISQLTRAVAQLPLQQAVYQPTEPVRPQAGGDFWDEAMTSLRGLVRVRTDRATAELPVLTLEGQALVRERMMLALEQAGSAVLRGQQTVYREALVRADALVRQHARAEAAQTRQFRQVIANLASTPATRASVPITALAAMAQIPRLPAPGLMPPPEAFGAPAAAPLEGVAQMLPVSPPTAASPTASPAAAPVAPR